MRTVIYTVVPLLRGKLDLASVMDYSILLRGITMDSLATLVGEILSACGSDVAEIDVDGHILTIRTEHGLSNIEQTAVVATCTRLGLEPQNFE